MDNIVAIVSVRYEHLCFRAKLNDRDKMRQWRETEELARAFEEMGKSGWIQEPRAGTHVLFSYTGIRRENHTITHPCPKSSLQGYFLSFTPSCQFCVRMMGKRLRDKSWSKSVTRQFRDSTHFCYTQDLDLRCIELGIRSWRESKRPIRALQ